jgi:transposase
MEQGAPPISLSRAERSALERWRANEADPERALKAGVILLAADGADNETIADATGVDRHTVGRWRVRFAELRLAGSSA